MKKNIILSTFLLLIISVSVASEYRLGRDYGSLSRPLPVKEDGVVDVVEVFWYGCGHCFNLAPITAKIKPTAFSKYFNCDTAPDKIPYNERSEQIAKTFEVYTIKGSLVTP